MNEEKEKIIAKARDLVDTFANEYSPAEEIHWIIERDNETEEEQIDESGEYFCEDCIEAAIEEYKKEHADKLTGKIVDSDGVPASVTEHEGFELCDRCGKKFNEGLLLDDQEMSHWEETELTASEVKNPAIAYELREIFTSQPYAFGSHYNDKQYCKEFQNRVFILANNIIKLLS